MYRSVIVLLTMFILGCTSNTVSLPKQTFIGPQVSDEQKLNSYTVELGKRYEFSLNNQSQTVVINGTTLPVAKLQLPQTGLMQIKLESDMTTTTVLAPQLDVINNGKIANLADYDHFVYVPQPTLHGHKMMVVKQLVNEEGNQLLIFPSLKYLDSSSGRIHPQNTLAVANGAPDPQLDDFQLMHTKFGELALTVSAPAKSDISPSDTSSSKVSTDYLTNIRKAVEADEMELAVQLLERAILNEVDGAKEAYLEAIRQKQK